MKDSILRYLFNVHQMNVHVQQIHLLNWDIYLTGCSHHVGMVETTQRQPISQ